MVRLESLEIRNFRGIAEGRIDGFADVNIIVGRNCVRAFLKASALGGSDAAVFHLSRENGQQCARRLDSEAVEALTATGVDVRFLDLYAGEKSHCDLSKIWKTPQNC